ncbi:hypothetical protein LOD99_15430 [Oopsacas minuta]|uniref:BZIP domain-containing protein n=1 Tax=Oopsacas minuta TaxID=111878 RepID=A0AAV7KBT2_9METZ|nr:hypothetical protein LOD99_15430 [Oopsacas minuta]
MNFDYPAPQYPGQVGEFYNQGFNFPLESYPNLSNEPHLPPAPSDIFTGYPQVYPPAPAHPHMSISSAQRQMYPPSISEYPSNGSNPWMSSPSPGSLLPPTSLPPVVTPQVNHELPTVDDQTVQQEFLSLLDEYHPVDNFYMHPMYQHPEGSQMFDNLSLPSPYRGANEPGEFSPPNTLLKPPLDDTSFTDYLQEDTKSNSDLKEDAVAGAENEDLSEINIRDLNKALRDQGYSQEEQMEVKQIRRKQKNRVYAKNCRKNKEEKKTTMKVQKEQLESEITDLKSDVDRLRAQRNQYKMSYDMMQQRKQQNS